MALGDLSSDQGRFVDQFAAATGLSRQVVVAWVGSESGWGTTKANHNYLNVGPGESYSSVEQAAARAASLVRTSSNYAGIRAAVPVGGAAQVKAIGESPWGTSAATLTQVYAGLVGAPTAGPTIVPVSLTDVAGDALKAIGGFVGGNPDATISGVAGVAKQLDLVDKIMSAGLTIVFTVAALALIGLGLNRLTGTPAKERFDQVSGIVSKVGAVAAVA